MSATNILLLFVATYINVMLLGLQSKNIHRSMYLAAFVTSMSITATNYVFVKFAVDKSGLMFVAVAGLGGALGIVTSIWLHDRFFNKRVKRREPMHEIVYLAGPYTHDDKAVMEERFELLTKAKARLMQVGNLVYSPITAGHATAVRHDLPREYSFWDRNCEAFVSRSDAVYVLKLPGWDVSTGVGAEIQLARDLGIPVRYIEPEFVQ